jgi:hypothetical protein
LELVGLIGVADPIKATTPAALEIDLAQRHLQHPVLEKSGSLGWSRQ